MRLRTSTLSVITAAAVGVGTLTAVAVELSDASSDVGVAIGPPAEPIAVTATPTATLSPSPTTTATPSPTASSSATGTPSPTATATERTPSATPTPTKTPRSTSKPKPKATPKPTPVTVVSTSHSYGSHARHQLDVFSSEALADAAASVRRPTVVMVHGGAWVKGSKSSMHGAAADLVRAGYIAIPVNYRLADDAAWPAQREDVQAAIRWVREHAADLHVDTTRIVVLGSSAGGEIAAAAVTEGDGSRYARGLVTLSAPVDLELVASNLGQDSSAGRLAGIVTEQLLQCVPDCEDPLRIASAVRRHDSRDPASLIITSKDEWVDPQSSYNFHAAAKADGVESTLKVLSGRAHGMNYWDRAWPIIRAWLDKRMAAKN